MERCIIKKENWSIVSGFRLPFIECPNCGQSLLGNSTHSISTNGDVNASVICPCGFHKFVSLEKWTGIEIKSK